MQAIMQTTMQTRFPHMFDNRLLLRIQLRVMLANNAVYYADSQYARGNLEFHFSIESMSSKLYLEQEEKAADGNSVT